jgi:hypothetical protein
LLEPKAEPLFYLFQFALLPQNSGMRCTAVLLVLLLSISLVAHPVRRHARVSDPSYSTALATANRFLHAWQTQDHEAGIMMLSDSARERTSLDQLQAFFSPSDQAAFEIQHGTRINGGEYVFPVVLFGVTESVQRPHFCRIVILRTSKGDWVVDKLP